MSLENTELIVPIAPPNMAPKPKRPPPIKPPAKPAPLPKKKKKRKPTKKSEAAPAPIPAAKPSRVSPELTPSPLVGGKPDRLAAARAAKPSNCTEVLKRKPGPMRSFSNWRRGRHPVAKPNVDPLRLALKAAMDSAAKAKALVEKQRATIDRIQSSVWQAKDREQAAQAEIAVARRLHASALATAENGKVPSNEMLVAARRKLTDVQDQNEAEKQALADSKELLPDMLKDARAAEIEVQAAVNRILEPLAKQVYQRLQKRLEALEPVRQMLACFWALGNQRPQHWEHGVDFDAAYQPLDDMRKQADELLHQTSVIRRADPCPFLAARKALQENPYAKLDQFD